MSEQLSDQARTAIQLANEEARHYGCREVGTVHVMLGIAREGTSNAADVLERHGLGHLALREAIDELALKDTVSNDVSLNDVLKHAVQECRNLGQNGVGSEHLLLGLLNADKSAARTLLLGLGVNTPALCKEIHDATQVTGEDEHLADDLALGSQLLSELGHQPDGVTIPFTPQTKRVVESAAAEAKKLHHDYLGPEHLLLGILNEGRFAAQILVNLGVDLQKIRNAIQGA